MSVEYRCDICGTTDEPRESLSKRYRPDGWFRCEAAYKFYDVCSMDCLKRLSRQAGNRLWEILEQDGERSHRIPPSSLDVTVP